MAIWQRSALQAKRLACRESTRAGARCQHALCGACASLPTLHVTEPWSDVTGASPDPLAGSGFLRLPAGCSLARCPAQPLALQALKAAHEVLENPLAMEKYRDNEPLYAFLKAMVRGQRP